MHKFNRIRQVAPMCPYGTTRRGGSRILQGRVSNPSERGTGGAPRHARRMCAYGGGVGAFSRKFENLDTLRCIFPTFQRRI